MLRLAMILALGFAVHMTATPTATAATRSVRHASPSRCYLCRPNRAWAGYEYRQQRGRANTAAGYTSMFGI